MRLKRLCGKTSAGKIQVPESVHEQWLHGDRTQLELAMAQALKIHGFGSAHKTRTLVRVRAPSHGFVFFFLVGGCCDLRSYV